MTNLLDFSLWVFGCRRTEFQKILDAMLIAAEKARQLALYDQSLRLHNQAHKAEATCGLPAEAQR